LANSRGRPAQEKEGHGEGPLMVQQGGEQFPVAHTKPTKTRLESPVDGRERTHPDRSGRLPTAHPRSARLPVRIGLFLGRAVAGLNIPIEPQHQGWDQRPTQHITGDHREHHRFGQRHEEMPGNPGKEKHRNENNADAEGADEGRKGDLLRPVEDRRFKGFPERHLTMDVLDLHRGVIDQAEQRARQAGQGLVGTLRIGIIAPSANAWLAGILRGFQQPFSRRATLALRPGQPGTDATTPGGRTRRRVAAAAGRVPRP